MKLIPKSQISNDFANDRAIQIKEGLALAKKIDVLRETLASLETQHANFLAGSQRELQIATEALTIRKNELENEISKLEVKRAKLQKPLDDEWAELKENQVKFKEDLENLATKSDELKTKEKDIEKETKRFDKERIASTERETETQLLYRQAEQDRTKALELKSARIKEYAEFKADADKRDEKQNIREKALLAQATFNEDSKEILNTREKELNNREQAINDKYQTLMRTINRIKNE